MASAQQLLQAFESLLEPGRFSDYGPNGALALPLRHDITLFAPHRPLDAHPQLGGNRQFGLTLGMQ